MRSIPCSDIIINTNLIFDPPCVFLGYSLSHMGYVSLDLQIQRIYISRHCVFLEESFPFVGVQEQA